MQTKTLFGWLGVSAAVPLVFWAAGFPAWAWGWVVGAGLGWLSFIWVGWALRRAFSQAGLMIQRTFFLQQAVRYGVITLVLVWAVQNPKLSIVALIVGYTFVQLPAAVLRSLPRSGGKK